MEFLAFFLINVIRIIKYAILVRVLMSWVRGPGASGGRITQMVYEITEPVLKVFRNLLPRTGMIDLSPLIAFFALDLAQIGVISIFAGLMG